MLTLQKQILSFATAAALLSGCGGSGSPPPQGVAMPLRRFAAAAQTGYVYVANESGYGRGGSGSVLVFSESSGGNVSPVNVIAGSQTQLTQVNGIAVNSAGEIYVVDTDTDQIVGFAPGTSGNVAPNVVIAGSQTQLAWPIGLAIDDSGNLWVANCGSGCESGLPAAGLLEFAAGSTGDASPLRDITGDRTQLTRSNGVAWRGRDVFVSQTSSVVVFDDAASGNATPKRVISGAQTGLNNAWGVAADHHSVYAGSCVADDVERFHRRASGDAEPAAVISGGKTKLDSCVDGVAVAQGGRVYAVTINSYPSVVGFYRFADGNVSPRFYIAGSNTELTYPTFVFATPAR
jgi:hypothetical protein